MAGTRIHQKMAEDYVNFIAPSSIPRAMKIEDVKRATDADDIMQYSIVQIIRSVSANTFIQVLDKIQAIFGIPEVIKSDNGAPVNSDAFASFAKHIGFRHRRVTECWRRGSAKAEGFNTNTDV